MDEKYNIKTSHPPCHPLALSWEQSLPQKLCISTFFFVPLKSLSVKLNSYQKSSRVFSNVPASHSAATGTIASKHVEHPSFLRSTNAVFLQLEQKTSQESRSLLMMSKTLQGSLKFLPRWWQFCCGIQNLCYGRVDILAMLQSKPQLRFSRWCHGLFYHFPGHPKYPCVIDCMNWEVLHMGC